MRLSAPGEYALRAVIFLSRQPGPTRAQDIARSERIPPAALRPLLRWLAAKGLVTSFQGPRGGYRLAADPAELTLRKVLEAVEGPLFINNCLLHGVPCNSAREHWCPVHEVWTSATAAFLKALEGPTVAELGQRIKRWESVESLLGQVLASTRKSAN